MKDTLTELLLDKDYASIVNTTMKVVENKIRQKIEKEKDDIKSTFSSSK